MHTYLVESEGLVTYTATVKVEANNEEEAMSKVEEQLSKHTPEELMAGLYEKSECNLVKIEPDYMKCNVIWEVQSVEEKDDEEGLLVA